MGKVICIANQKGGVGKTTTCVNLGTALAKAGKKVCLIDLDPQGSLTQSLGCHNPDEMEFTMADVLRSEIEDGDKLSGSGSYDKLSGSGSYDKLSGSGSCDKLSQSVSCYDEDREDHDETDNNVDWGAGDWELHDKLSQTFRRAVLHHKEGMDLIPGNIDLAGLEVSMVNLMSRELILKTSIQELRDKYEYTLIDCMPSLGMLTVNALAASDEIITPVQAAYLPAKGLEQLLLTVSKVRRQINRKLKIEGILLSMVDARTNYAKEIISLIYETYAATFAGYPYVWGGDDPHTGADCSGFVRYVYAQFGISLPRVAEDQAMVGQRISVSDALPGDLVFMMNDTDGIYHVVIYAGNGRTLEAKGRNYGIGSWPMDYSHAGWAVRLICIFRAENPPFTID